jgi:hypothetical protein
VATWHVRFLDDGQLGLYQQNLGRFLASLGYQLDERPFLPHVTLARRPFRAIEWEEAFKPLPCWVEAIHLYESLGNLTYKPIWSHPFTIPWTRTAQQLIVTASNPGSLGPTCAVAWATLRPDLTPSLLHMTDPALCPAPLISLEPTRAVFEI